jgi:hypothetical protein
VLAAIGAITVIDKDAEWWLAMAKKEGDYPAEVAMTHRERADARIAALKRWHGGDDDILVRPGSDIGLLLHRLSIGAACIASLTETIARLRQELDAGRRWAAQYERDHGAFKTLPPDHLLTF